MVLENTSAEVHLLALAVVIIVATMAIGQEIAKLVIGGTSVIDADSVGTLSATAATAPGQLAGLSALLRLLMYLHYESSLVSVNDLLGRFIVSSSLLGPILMDILDFGFL